MPSAELSRERIAETLAERGVDKALTETFIGILDACEFARYSPDSGNEAMTAHYNSAIDVISSIDSSMKSVKTSSKKAYMAVLLLIILPSVASARSDSYVDSLWNAAMHMWKDAGKMQSMTMKTYPLSDWNLQHFTAIQRMHTSNREICRKQSSIMSGHSR